MSADRELTLMIMSGVEDGKVLELSTKKGHGDAISDKWTLSIGRREENDICLRNDTYVSRQHARLHLKNGDWWLEDLNSTNGSFIENANDFFDDQSVKGFIQLRASQLFRVGRTWLRIQAIE